VLEVVRIRREAYPVRVPFSEFYDRFELLYTREARKVARAAAAETAGGATPKSVTLLPPPADASSEQAQLASKAILARHIGAESAYYQVRAYLKCSVS
jgi:myosin heavy subunit